MRFRASPILPNVVTIQLAESGRLQPTVHEGHLNAETFRFAIVASRWNELISARLVEGALDALKRLGAGDEQVDLYRVPGSFEIPLLALRLAQSRTNSAFRLHRCRSRTWNFSGCFDDGNSGSIRYRHCRHGRSGNRSCGSEAGEQRV